MSVDSTVESQVRTAVAAGEPPAKSLDRAAREAGIIYLAFAILSAWGYFYLANQFRVRGDPVGTVHRMFENASLYRLGLLSNLVSQFLFIFTVLALYELFKGVDRRLARQMVAIVCVGVAAEIVNIGIRTAPLTLLGREDFLTLLTKPQVDALALAFVRVGNDLGAICVGFWGVWLVPFGLLTIKSGFLPKILGYLLLLSAVGYIATCITSTAFPAQLPMVSKLVFPLAFGELPIILWLAVMGAKVRSPA